MTPAEVVDEVRRSGLRGRGGAGYPTGLKWATGRQGGRRPEVRRLQRRRGRPRRVHGPQRPGERPAPRAGRDGDRRPTRSGRSQGYIYVRGEYPLAIDRLQTRHQAGASGSGCSAASIFEHALRLPRSTSGIGAGAFVCGEETALIASIEGQRGTPRPRPPYPAEAGLWGRPTLINNVETFANVAADHPQRRRLVRRRSARRRARAPRSSRWPARSVNTGLVEVPMGTTLRQIVEEIGGGIADGGTIKAVQTGGPSGGCIPAEHARHAGRLRVADRARLDHGLRRHDRHGRDDQHGRRRPVLHGVLHGRVVRQVHPLPGRHRAAAPAARPGSAEGRATRGRPRPARSSCATWSSDTSLCGLGQAAPNPVLSTLRYFRDEYASPHAAGCRAAACPAGVLTAGRARAAERRAA